MWTPLWGFHPLCSDIELDPLGHYAVTCRRGGDAVLCYNHLCDAFVEFCHQAHLSVKVEGGSGLTPDMSPSHHKARVINDMVGRLNITLVRVSSLMQLDCYIVIINNNCNY